MSTNESIKKEMDDLKSCDKTRDCLKKPGIKKRLSAGSPTRAKRSFSLKWLQHEDVKDWALPYVADKSFTKCRYCGNLIRAHLADMKAHARSNKHKRRKTDYIAHGGTISDSIALFETKLQHHANVEPAELGALTGSYHGVVQPAHIGFIGCGNMAQALLSGFIKNGLVEPTKVIASAPSDKNLSKVRSLGISTTHDNDLVVASSDLIFLSVKPEILEHVINDLKPIEGDRNPLFVSVIGGLTIHDLEMKLLPVTGTPRVVRTLPNTPSMVSQGCCVYSLGSRVTPEEGQVVQDLLSAVGVCEMVPEDQINAAGGLSSSGPAYIYMVIEALADGGVKMGLPRQMAQTLAVQTVKGAAAMVVETGKHPTQLKEEVCSPGGTTMAAVHTLEKNGLRNALISAVEASANRSEEIGQT